MTVKQNSFGETSFRVISRQGRANQAPVPYLKRDAEDRIQDFEEAILREMENFILELGCGFTFIARQKRMIID